MAEMTPLTFATGETPIGILPRYANRHGLIAGATGTGKTVTLQTLAEGFSRMGVPVFMADVKGDLAGLSQPGGGNPKVEKRASELGLDLDYQGFPVVMWDVFGEQGHPVRTTVSEMGPLLLSRLLSLTEAQEGALNVAFRVADDNGLLLLDLKDLRAMLTSVAENASQLRIEYGQVSSTSVGAIQRSLLVLEEQGGEAFLGEPAFDLMNLLQCAPDGRGLVHVLAANRLMQSPRLYATFLLWMLSELFENLPEVGDLDKPRLVFFFDEAHLLFDDASKALVEKVEQVVRLIRSKGVGVYFVTQNPIDIPDTVLGQLGNRVQHALRAFTPRDQKAVKVAAETFRPNPKIDTMQAILEVGVGEALVSVLGPDGAPTPVQRAFVHPPCSRLGAVSESERQAVLRGSPFFGRYEKAVDRESAYEMLTRRAAAEAEAEQRAKEAAEAEKLRKVREKEEEREYRRAKPVPRRRSNSDTVVEAVVKSTLRSAGSQVGRSLVRGLLGSLFKR